MGYTYAQRLNVIEQKRAKLERQLAELQQKEKTITAREREIERKELARKKYRLGGLVMLASEKLGCTFSDEALLGALLQIFNEKDSDRLRSWERYGSGLLKNQRHELKKSASAQGFTQTALNAENTFKFTSELLD